MFRRVHFRALLLTVVSVCASLGPGCAGLRCPRIDPSGERLFICSRDRVPPVTAVTTNAQAPPVYTDPVFPQPIAGQPVGGLVPSLPQDHLTITPDRVLAPVGSEVILKAGLCTRDNYMLTDSKVDWLLARDTAGEFVSLGGRGWLRNPLLPWNKPEKVDNQYATGYTSRTELRITRGTADQSDDVVVLPGEAWASVTSPVEGTSRITAVAPEIATWANRRATATIYWVDVQWTFPPATVSAGGAQVLTTTVRRQTDGTPIEGWLVRYEVGDGTGALSGSGSGQSVEVATDADGRASIDVTPTGSAGSVTQIKTQIVRPAGFGGTSSPRLVIANGTSTINWTDGGSDYVPPPDDLGSPLPPTFGGGSTSPPIQPTPAPKRGPVLDLEVRQITPEVRVGGEVRFEVVIRNVGDSVATGVVLRDVFDNGLTHLRALPGGNEIERTNVGNIDPGDFRSFNLTFGVNRAGTLRQVLTATCQEGARIEKQATVNAEQPQRQAQGELRINKVGPRLATINERALFTLSITNVGDAPLTDLQVEDQYDQAFQVQQIPQGAQIVNGTLFWSIQRLDQGQTWTREINCLCVAAKAEARSTVSVSAVTGTLAGTISKSEFSRTEIRLAPQDVTPPVSPGPGGNVMPGVVPPAGGADVVPGNTGSLRMELTPFSNPARVGSRATFQVVISNRGTASEQQVRLRVIFPPELMPDVAAIHNDANVAAQFNQGELLFAPVAELRNGERLEFLIPCNVLRQGVRNVTAELLSQNMPQAIRQVKEIELIN